jgi:arylsulfatase
MRDRRCSVFLRLIGIALAILGCSSAVAEFQSPAPPNILVILLDDVGFSDLGAYGSEIRTPNIDRIASRGVSFGDFHVSMTCSPTRAMLLSGIDNHLVGLGNMATMASSNQKGQAGYEGYLTDSVETIASQLQRGGYKTYMTGKWHLGFDEKHQPHSRGFDRSFALLDAGASQFSDMRGLIEYRPKATYVDDGKVVESLPPDFHTSEYFASKLIEFIEQDRESKTPFFAYFSPTATHWPYQLPDRYLDLYEGVYDAGYDVLRQQRFAAVREKGLVSKYPDAFLRLDGVTAWESLSAEDQRTEARKMELYAASLEHLDLQIGRLLDALQELEQLQNTVIFVLSDNGPEGNDRSRVATNKEWLPRAWDLSYENMGKRDSYVYYGAGWAQASATPFWLFKAFAGEGGIRVPLIVSLPGGERAGDKEESFATVLDIVPTIRQLAAIGQRPEPGRSPATSGASLLPVLQGSAPSVHGDNYRHGWELFGHRALRKGRWKLLRLEGDQGTGNWQLFDIANDPGEANDLAAKNPEKVLELKEYWDEYVQQNNVILPDSNQQKAFGF